MLNLLLFLLGILATHRIARLIVEDQIFAPLRDRIWKKYPPATALGYFFTCYWCTSIWAATVLVVGYILLPYITIAISAILALSDAASILEDLRQR